MTEFFSLIDFANFSWRQSLWLLGLLLPIILFGLQFFIARKRQISFADPKFWPWVLVSKSNRFLPNFPLIFAWILLVFALAGPRFAEKIPLPEQSSGADLLVLLDVSKSMQADDLQPNRFAQAQAVLESLLNRLQPVDRAGLLVFSYQAHWASFLSFDKDLFKRNLYLLEPEILPLAGSQSLAALEFALDELEVLNLQKPITILLVADELEEDFLPAVERIKTKLNQLQPDLVSLVFLAVGTAGEVNLPDSEHPSGWLQFAGKRANVGVDFARFKQVSDELGEIVNAKFLPLDGSAKLLSELQEIIYAQNELLATEETEIQYRDFSLYLVFLAWLILLLVLKLPRFSWLKVAKFSMLLPIFAVIFLAGLPHNQAWSSDKKPGAQTAYDAMDSRNYDIAEKLFNEMADRFAGNLGAGKANLIQKNFLPAIEYFKQAILEGTNDAQRAEALFALGEAFAQAKTFELAIETWQAVDLYQQNYPELAEKLAWAKEQLAKQQAENPELNQALGENDLAEFDQSVFDPNASSGFGQELTEADLQESEALRSHPNLPSRNQQATENSGEFQVFASEEINSNSLQQQLTEQRILDGLSLELEQLADEQQAILRHLFEREAGFEAKQQTAHQVPGVAPW